MLPRSLNPLIRHRIVFWIGLFLAGAVSIAHATPVILQQPQNQTVPIGGVMTFSVIVAPPPPTGYQWQVSPPGIPAYFNVSGATGSSYSTTVDATMNGNLYRCVVTDLSGSVNSQSATLSIPAPPQAPSLMTQPQDAVVSPGQSATYSLIALGDTPLNYQWQLRLPGAAPPDFNNITGATAASYTLANAQMLNSGSQFRCVVSNATGTVMSAAANLTVVTNGVAPVITQQPQSQTAPWGQMVAFSVQATGTPAPTYQWQVSPPGTPTFSDMLGETNSSYITTSNPTIDGARFRCVVSNVAGTVFSNVATLTVGSACDLNADGTTNVVDVQREVNMALGVTPCTADINLDSVCNVVDVQRVVNNALGGPCVSP